MTSPLTLVSPKQARRLCKRSSIYAFTLIELSIVLVIVGLVAGGVIVGKDMIKNAEQRALISQLEQFKAATMAFKNRYRQLPGDMSPANATKYGFLAFTGAQAGTMYGDQNGAIFSGMENYCFGECSMFWRHLAEANLLTLDTSVVLVTDTSSRVALPLGENELTPYSFSKYMPKAKLGNAFIGVNSVSKSVMFEAIPQLDQNANLFYLAPPARIETASLLEPSMSPIDLYLLDSKIDDGMPLRGKVINSTFENNTYGDFVYWSNGSIDYNNIALNANSRVCTIGGASAIDVNQTYNTNISKGGNSVACQPAFIW